MAVNYQNPSAQTLNANLSADDVRLIDRQNDEKNPENLAQMLFTTPEGNALAGKSIRFGPQEKHVGTFLLDFDYASKKIKNIPDEKDQEAEEKKLQANYDDFLDHLGKRYGDNAHLVNDRLLSRAILNSKMRNIGEIVDIDNQLEEYTKNNKNSMFKQELVKTKQDLLNGMGRIEDAYGYIDFLKAGAHKNLQLIPERITNDTEQKFQMEVNKILDMDQKTTTNKDKRKLINAYYKTLGLTELPTMTDNDFAIYAKAFKQLPLELLTPARNEVLLKFNIESFLNTIGNPKKLTNDQKNQIIYFFNKYGVGRDKLLRTARLDEFTTNLKNYLANIQIKEKKLLQPVEQNLKQQEEEAENALHRVFHTERAVNRGKPIKTNGFMIEYADRIIYAPTKEEDLIKLKKLAEEGKLFLIDQSHGRLKKITNPIELMLGEEYLQYKIVGGAFEENTAYNVLNHQNKTTPFVNHKTYYNEIVPLMSYREFLKMKENVGGGIGSLFHKIGHKVSHIAKNVAHDVVKSAKQLGSDVATDIRQSGRAIGRDVRQISKNPLKGIGNLAKDVGVAGVRQLGNAVDFVQSTPGLRELNTAVQFVPGVGSAVAFAEGATKILDESSRGNYNKALTTAVKTVPSVLIGGSLFSGGRYSKSGVPAYHGSIFNNDVASSDQFYGGAYTPIATVRRGDLPTYEGFKLGGNFGKNRPDYMERNIARNGKIKKYSYIDPYDRNRQIFY